MCDTHWVPCTAVCRIVHGRDLGMHMTVQWVGANGGDGLPRRRSAESAPPPPAHHHPPHARLDVAYDFSAHLLKSTGPSQTDHQPLETRSYVCVNGEAIRDMRVKATTTGICAPLRRSLSPPDLRQQTSGLVARRPVTLYAARTNQVLAYCTTVTASRGWQQMGAAVVSQALDVACVHNIACRLT